MKKSSLTALTNTLRFLFYWIIADFSLGNNRKKISEISRTPWRNCLYPAPAFFLLLFSQYKGLECKKIFLKASETGTLWIIRALKQIFNTKLYRHKQFHKAMLLIWLKDFYKFVKLTGLIEVLYGLISTQFPMSWPFSPVSLNLSSLHWLSIKTQAEQQLSCQKRTKLCQGWRRRRASKFAISVIMHICAIHFQTHSGFLLLPKHLYHELTDKGTFIIQTPLIN